MISIDPAKTTHTTLVITTTQIESAAVVAWLRDHVPSYVIDIDLREEQMRHFIGFADEADAVRFAMRWM